MDKNKKVVRLNKEQLAAVKHKKGPLLIIAGAGTGKTTVITERIKYLIEKNLAKPSEILALTFTEKAAREMEERVDIAMPYGYTNMWISTFHAFCDRVLRAEALHIGLDPRFKLMTEAESIQFIRSNLFGFNLDYFRPLGNPNKFIGGVLKHFSRLQDEDVAPSEYADYVKKLTGKKRKEEDVQEAIKWKELSGAYKKYEELKVKEGVMDFGDLIVKTLKLFRERKNILKTYQSQFKVVLVDEFQDTNYAQNELAMLIAGKGTDASITATGDDDQCLPPTALISTPNGKKQIKNIKVGDEVISAAGRGHTTNSRVSKVFKKRRRVRFLTFRTEDGNKLTITDNHKMFCFIPAHYKFQGWYLVYLMQKEDVGWRIGVTKNLPGRLRMERGADKILAIGSYKTEEEARFYEAYYSAKYGLPTIPFEARQRQAIAGLWLEKLFEDINTEGKACNIARDFALELDSPQFMVNGVTRGKSKRVKINFNMCDRNYRSKTNKKGFVGNPSIFHSVTVETSNRQALIKLKRAGFSLSKARKGERFRFQSKNIKEAWEMAERLVKITGGIIDKKFKVGRHNYKHLPARIVPASHIFQGMYLPVLKGREIKYKMVVSREEETKEIDMYDLEIYRSHNYVSDGIVVHNSIYRFRGAAISNIIQFRKNYPKTKIVVLTKNYRSTQVILDKAYQLIQHNNPDRLEAVEKIDKKLKSQRKKKVEDDVTFIHKDRVENEAEAVVGEIRKLVKEKSYDYKDFAILVRANNHSEPFIRALQRKGLPYQFLGPGRLFKQPEIIDFVSYLKVLYNFEDSVSFFRLLSINYFKVDAKDLARMGNYARRYNLSLYEVCEKIDDIYVSSKTKENIGLILKIVEKHLKLVRKETAGQLLYLFLEETGLIQELIHPDTPEVEKKAVNISKFFDKLKSYEINHEDATVSAVVDWIELSSELGESPLAADTDWTDVNAVNLLTVHSAKGLEFPIVFLVNLVSQRFPTIERREQIPIPESLIKEILPKGDFHEQEERRLFYVGMTRAKEKLYFSAANYYGEGKREKRLSPFVFESLGDEAIASETPKDDSKQLSFLDYKASAKKIFKKEAVKDIHLDYLSYSQINTFNVCPLHYKLRYILKVPVAPSAALSFGTSIHSVMKDFYTLIKKGEKPTNKLMMDLLSDNWEKGGYTTKSHEEIYFQKGKSYLKDYLKKEFNPKMIPEVIEQSFVTPLPFKKGEKRLKIGGKIDRVDTFSDGSIEVIDYKTSVKLPTQKDIDNDLQLTFYALAAASIKEEPFGKNPEDINLSLYFFEKQQKLTTKRTREQLKDVIDEIFEWRRKIENSDFRCSGNYLCNNCEYKMICNADLG